MSSQVVVKYVENSALLHQKKVQMYLPTLLKCEMRGTSGFKMHLKETTVAAGAKKVASLISSSK